MGCFSSKGKTEKEEGFTPMNDAEETDLVLAIRSTCGLIIDVSRIIMQYTCLLPGEIPCNEGPHLIRLTSHHSRESDRSRRVRQVGPDSLFILGHGVLHIGGAVPYTTQQPVEPKIRIDDDARSFLVRNQSISADGVLSTKVARVPFPYGDPSGYEWTISSRTKTRLIVVNTMSKFVWAVPWSDDEESAKTQVGSMIQVLHVKSPIGPDCGDDTKSLNPPMSDSEMYEFEEGRFLQATFAHGPGLIRIRGHGLLPMQGYGLLRIQAVFEFTFGKDNDRYRMYRRCMPLKSDPDPPLTPDTSPRWTDIPSMTVAANGIFMVYHSEIRVMRVGPESVEVLRFPRAHPIIAPNVACNRCTDTGQASTGRLHSGVCGRWLVLYAMDCPHTLLITRISADTRFLTSNNSTPL